MKEFESTPERILPKEPHEAPQRPSDPVHPGQRQIRPPERSIESIRADRQRTYLLMKARGVPRQQIAKSLGISLGELGRETERLNEALGIRSEEQDTALHAILSAMDSGVILPEEVLGRFDREKFSQLRIAPLQLLEDLIYANGRYSSNAQLAARRGTTEKGIEGRITRLNNKLGTTTKDQIGALYKAHKMLQ